MKRLLVFAVAAAIVAFGSPFGVSAQTSTLTVQYAAGWNMAGGPPGSNFSVAASIAAYGPSGYFTPTPDQIGGCSGFWAYFLAPTNVSLPTTSTSPTASCTLQTGWNLLGNPFSGMAELPPGVTAFHWNPSASRYDTVATIPTGGSVWVYSAASFPVTLQYFPASAQTLVISDLTNHGPYTVHVGDAIELLIASETPTLVTADAQYLQSEGAGLTGPLSCLNDPSCALSLVNNFWKYRAIKAGTTYLTLSPVCSRATPPCAQPSSTIQIDIVP